MIFIMGKEKTTILLVDDSSTNNILLQAVLEQNGFATETAFSGKEALKILSKKHIDVILLDLMMPEMSGYDVLIELKRNPDTAQIPVMIVSADNEKDDEDKALKLGADLYLEKPLKLNEVIEKVKELTK